jgi:hypothetical protein
VKTIFSILLIFVCSGLYGQQFIEADVIIGKDSVSTPILIAGRVNIDSIIINDSTIKEIYQGVIPDTTEVSRMIEEKKIDCENLHAYINAVNNGVIDCENAFLFLTASSNQADVSYQWDGSISGDMGTSNPLIAAIAETITLTVTNNTTSCGTTKDITITYDTITPTFEKFISSNIAGELVLSAFVTNQQDSTEYGYTWSETGSGIQTDVHGQSIKVNATGTYEIQILNKNTGCNSTESIVISESDLTSTDTIADNDATPDVTGATTWTYNGTANSVVITDLDNPIVGKTYRIIGNSDTYTITINDGGNFNLEGNWTGGIDDVIMIYVQADNDYIQVAPAVDN